MTAADIKLPPMLTSWFSEDLLGNLLAAAVVLLIGLPLVALVPKIVYRLTSVRFSGQAGLMISRIVRWLLIAVLLATLLNQFDVNLGAALGAAGIVGIAVGFAAQTSLSNVISGFFLLGERPFVVGDVIEVDGVTGVVDNIGMISASVRTLDNRSVRIPNESLVKSKVTNISRHPIRRYDLEVGVSCDADIGEVMRVLREAADSNPHCLDEPGPLVAFSSFGESSINFLLGVWAAKEDYLLVRNTIAHQVQLALAREGIGIAYPHRILEGAKGGEPIRVRVTKDDDSIG
jgi:small-conductance mechanosensitive channel